KSCQSERTGRFRLCARDDTQLVGPKRGSNKGRATLQARFCRALRRSDQRGRRAAITRSCRRCWLRPSRREVRASHRDGGRASSLAGAVFAQRAGGGPNEAVAVAGESVENRVPRVEAG